ncbi:MAG: M43 family zinc metalloprotease, partial [Bacteroidota bacterium]
MKLILSLSLFFLSITLSSLLAQTHHEYCAQHHVHQKWLRRDIKYKKKHNEMEAILLQASQNKQLSKSQSVITLPVVFHIIHDNGVENIPAERIDQELENLNAAFANTGYYNPATGVDVEVQFCLASRTPEGMPFDGINRVQSPLTEFNYNTQEVAVKTLSRFDALQYINIWVVREVCSNNGCNAVAGYAYLPGAHGRTIDGIVLEAEFVGLTEARSTVLIHEMGHYLGLYHTFERGCGNNDCQSSGDRVCDTPPDNTVANVPCSDPSNSCNTDADDTSINNPFRPVAEGGLGDQPDQIQNYMDYSRQACYDRFTQGQKERMINVINNIRSSLLSSPACLPPCDNPVAAEFTVPNNSISVGEPLIFTNNSQNANRFEWYVNENLVSTVRDLNYTFTDGGNFTVRLLAYSADQDCIVKSFETIVKVNCVLEANIDLTTPIFNIGDSIVISTSTGKSTNINWQINNLAVSTDSSFTFIGSEAGIYQVCLELTEGNCQSQTCTFISVVDPLEEATCGQSLFYELLHSGILNILSMIPASDDAFYVGGILEDESADPAFLMKFSNAGNLLWQVRISTGLNNVEFNHMVEDGDFLVGILSSSVDGSHIFKLNTNTQDLVWMKWVAERSFYTSRVFLNDGNYVVLGEYQSLFDLNDPITSNYLIVDSDNGDLISSTAYGFGNLSNSVDAVQIESNIYAVGYSRLADGARLGMTSYAENGTINWSKTYIENSSQNNGLFIQNMDKDDNALILTGGASSFNRINFVIKTNLEGEIIWAKELNLPEFSSYGLTAVYTTEDAYWVTGTAATLSSRIGAFCFIKLDKDGNILSANYIPSVNLNRRIIGINPFFNTPKGFYQDRSITSILNPTLTTTPSFIRFVDNQDNCFPLWETTAVANDLTGIVADDFSPTPVNKVINVANAVSPLVENGQLVINNTCNCSLTEICDDGIDNDLDNIVDCLDTDCNCESDCGEEFVLTSAQNDHPEGIYAVGQGVDKKFLTLGFRDQTYILSKVDQTGNALWVKNLDFDSNLGFDDFRANEIFLNDDGFIYLILNGSNLLKYDTTAHQVLWAKQFFVTGSFLSTQLLNIEEDPTTNRLFAYLSFTQIDAEAVVEIDKSDGSVLWETVLSPSDFTTIRGGGFVQSDFTAYNGQIAIINYRSQDIGSVIFLDDDGQFGSSFNTLTNGGFSGDFRFRSAQLLENSLLIAFEARENGTTKAIPALMEVSRLGTVRWVKEYNFSGFDASTFEYDFQVIDDGYLILGSVGNNNSVKNSLLFKVDKDGNGQWASSLGNRDNYILHNSRTGQKVVIDSSGVFLASSIIQNGNLNRQSLFIKMDEQGQLPSNTCSFQRNLEWTQKNGPRYRFIDIEFSESQTPVERDELTVTVSDAPPSATSFLCAPQECCQIDLGINIDTAFCNVDSLTISLYIKNESDSTFNG